ncbi:TonB-dependent receptor [Sulfurimonas denitrificans DSM 1251]|uniref:TonB-dependent receptor n=1 Tax=Sulfurimonas denitrificans (strain ATCC 33889 / DSM 1251) TaxID=326298 RepID=Q30TM3_SULDN|nr:TonB-dependent receptor [Sulfurimonas denitrificans]ABB43658.1 TonB-dependent receptor [Sulfurimonas denitrificans DSM 1251]MDD3442547.1 TonB-dependent receptor [Sulfurimonas denitrificans]
MLSKKIIPLSLVAVTILGANEVALPSVNVESTTITEVSQNAQVSADLAQALSSSVPSIDMNRRSGIANDIFIRGQKRDNISVEVDGTKVCGACPNRMDPPVSHILANQIDKVEVIEGPYDVETFGTMSGGLKITTKKPTKDMHGEVNFGLGSWGYKKLGVTGSGGTDTIRALISASYETSDQYKDGNGDTLSEQVDKAITNGSAPAMTRFQTQYKDIEAYTKKSIMSKVFVKTLEDQELRLSYTGNRSDDVLYANSKMDAAYDDSNIYSVEYNIDNVTNKYKNINIQYYYSDVDHPMDTKYRVSGATSYMTNHLKTSMQGVKLKNSFDLDEYKILFGLDGSRRTWEGRSYGTNATTGVVGASSVSLTHTQTDNRALFAKVEKSFGDLKIESGARFDSTTIKPDDVTKQDNDYSALNANIIATYSLDAQNSIFLGVGSSARVPDARELYIGGLGTQNLKQTKNREIDLGYEASYDSFMFKAKTFYSMLEDYIYLKHTSPTAYAFENIDAKVYGLELSGSYFITDALTMDASASYKKGRKTSTPTQKDRDLSDIAPLRGNVALNYEYMNNSKATLEMQASDRWDTIDSDNGEQELAGWSIYNAKVKHAINKYTDLSVGVNNIFDKTYKQSNSYVDLTLLTLADNTMLLNEPGRYFYTNLTFKF